MTTQTMTLRTFIAYMLEEGVSLDSTIWLTNVNDAMYSYDALSDDFNEFIANGGTVRAINEIIFCEDDNVVIAYEGELTLPTTDTESDDGDILADV